MTKSAGKSETQGIRMIGCIRHVCTGVARRGIGGAVTISILTPLSAISEMQSIRIRDVSISFIDPLPRLQIHYTSKHLAD